MTATAEKPTCQYNEANDVKGVEKKNGCRK